MRDSMIIGYTSNDTPYTEVHECPYCGSTVYLYTTLLGRELRPGSLKCGGCGEQFSYGNSTRIE